MGFVMLAAFAEGRSVRLEESMRRLRVGQFAVWDRGGVSPDDPIAMALRQGAHDLAVTDNGQLVGMVWRQQLVDAMSHGGLQRQVSEIMDRRFVVDSAATHRCYEAQRIMNESEPMDHPGCRWRTVSRSLYRRSSCARPTASCFENTRATTFFADSPARSAKHSVAGCAKLSLAASLGQCFFGRLTDPSSSPYDLLPHLEHAATGSDYEGFHQRRIRRTRHGCAGKTLW